jgi:uncharacterized protein
MHFGIKQWFTSTTTLLLLTTSMFSQATDKGLFWKMQSPSGQVSYLFGTIHTDDNRVTDFSSSILDVLKRVDLFVMETQPNNGPVNYSMQDGSLKTMLTEDEMDQVRALTDFHVMHLEQALKMKPWLLALVFSQSKPQTPYAQDNLLMRAAEDFGKPVNGLETNQAHFGIIDSFSLDEQLVILRAALKLKQEEKERDFEKLINVYLTEDSDSLLHIDSEITSATLPKPLWKKMRVKLLDERNDLMAKRALDLANTQSVFIAVGAAHLAGENGFIQAFKDAGYQLTRMKK